MRLQDVVDSVSLHPGAQTAHRISGVMFICVVVTRKEVGMGKLSLPRIGEGGDMLYYW